MVMHLIAEAGATKINWVLIRNQVQKRFITAGYNPNTADANYLRQLLVSGFPSDEMPTQVSEVTYFGAGCGNTQGFERVNSALKGFFEAAKHIIVLTDLEASARAYLGKNSGIVGILGTGANAGYFEGGLLKDAPFSTGFLLGDEGSGAHIGKQFVASYLRGYLPSWMGEKFENQFEVTKEVLFEKVYNANMLNRYFAQFVPFIELYKNESVINEIVFYSLKEYVKHYVKPLCCNYKNVPIIITGGVAEAFSEELCIAFGQSNIFHVKTGNRTFELLLEQL